MRRHQKSTRVWLLLQVNLLLGACVLSPSREFKRQYEEWAIGKSFNRTIASKSDRSERIQVLPNGNEIYRRPLEFFRRPEAHCVLYYEVSADIVVRAWHEGKDCWIAN